MSNTLFICGLIILLDALNLIEKVDKVNKAFLIMLIIGSAAVDIVRLCVGVF